MSMSDMQKIRPYTFAAIEAFEEGLIDPKSVVSSFLMWLDDRQVSEWLRANDFTEVLKKVDGEDDSEDE